MYLIISVLGITVLEEVVEKLTKFIIEGIH